MKYKKSLVWDVDDNVIEESKKYSSRGEFYKGSHGAYVAAKEKGLLDKMPWLNSRNVYKDPVDTVYRYYFTNENAVYVGRTIYPDLRDRQHRTREKDSVLKFSIENNAEIPEMEVLEENLTVLEGAEREAYWAKYYKDNGFTMINKQPCGSLGYMTRGKWSKKKCFEEGMKYKNRTEFRTNASYAFYIAGKNGWLDEMDWMPIPEKGKPCGYWNDKERIIEESKKYKTLTEFQKNSAGACNAAKRLGILDELTWLEKCDKLPFGYWKDKEHCMEEAKKYTSKKEFQQNCQSAYWASLKYGYLEEMVWLAKKKKKKKGLLTNKDYVMEEAKKYKSRSEMLRKNRSIYEAAHRYGWIDEMDWLPKNESKPSRYWNIKGRVIEESKKYISRTDFKNESPGAYKVACTRGWINEMNWLPNKNEKGAERPRRKYITKEDVFEESKKYTNRTNFNKKSRKAYEIARKNKWLDEMHWLDKKQEHPGNFKWTKEKCIEEGKKYKTRSEFMKNSNSAYQRSLKMGYLDEMTWLSCSRNYPRGYWMDKEHVMEEAKKYSSKKEFEEKNCGAFLAAYKYNYIEEMDWLVKQVQKPSGYWKDKNNVIKESKKFSTSHDFLENAREAYRQAKINGWLDEMTWLNKKTTRRTKNYWKDKNNVIEESKKYVSKTEFKKKCNNAYDSARINGWLSEMSWLDDNNEKHPKGYWKNRDNIMEEARKYSTKEEFQKGNLYAFLAAYKYCYIDEMFWLTKQKQHKKNYWTYETIEKEALKYNTKTEFYKNNQTAYKAALKLGIIDDFFINNYIEY